MRHFFRCRCLLFRLRLRLCNTCTGPSLLFLGAARVQRPLVFPGVEGSGCDLLVRVDFILLPDTSGEVSLVIPGAAALAGVSFYLQRADTTYRSTYGSTGCRPPRTSAICWTPTRSSTSTRSAGT